jgi:hypothetical protein
MFKPEELDPWITVSDITISRTHGFSYGFDNMYHCYKLLSSNNRLSLGLSKGFYFPFSYSINDLLFLRYIDGYDSWPKTKLMMINLKDMKLVEIFCCKSTMVKWIVTLVDEATLKIVTGQRKDKSGTTYGYLLNINNGINLQKAVFNDN